MFKKAGEYEKLRDGISGSITWKSPSNIALVKYWGKKADQLPENPNLSFSLKNSYTSTSLTYNLRKKGKPVYRLYFHGKEMDSFMPKLDNFFSRITEYLPFLDYADMLIESENTFPHSAGIASSASSMSALALCLMSIYSEVSGDEMNHKEFFRRASFLARLGSGSACRSVYPAFSSWGLNDLIHNGSDQYATSLPVKNDSYFLGLQDAILIVDRGEKSLSSSSGHGLMQDHPFADARYNQARENFSQIIYAIQTENKELFMEVTENEALSLHALMMSSVPGTLLLKPGSIEIIERIRKFREEHQLFICYTIDAGPNIHVLYHRDDRNHVEKFLDKNLRKYCQDGMIIFDGIGNGPEKIS